MELPVFFGQIIDFFADGMFLKILFATLILFFIMFITWWVYKSLSNKNLFNFLHRHDILQLERPTFMDHFLHFLRYVILFPLYSFAGLLIFALALFILIRPEDPTIQENIFFTAIVLVSTIRISAHVNESLAEDLAKLVPLSMLGLLITNTSALQSIGVDVAGIKGFILTLPGSAKYLVFIVILEIVLRIFEMIVGVKAGFDPEEPEGVV